MTFKEFLRFHSGKELSLNEFTLRSAFNLSVEEAVELTGGVEWETRFTPKRAVAGRQTVVRFVRFTCE